MKKLKLIFGVIIVALLGFMISIPIVNDNTANRTAKSVKEIELPNDTEYIESFSKAGKLVGNGNGMQYLGGILIKSNLSLEELQAHYSKYAKSEWEYIVEKKSDKEVRVVEHGSVLLKSDINDDNYYIVYSWGDEYSIYSQLDLRGH